jgi:hypothetical protein
MFAPANRATGPKAGADAARDHRGRSVPARPKLALDHQALQGAIGNQATLRLLSRCAQSEVLQCQARVSDPQDPAEQQAEQVAAKVGRAPARSAPRSSEHAHQEVAREVLAQIQSAGSGAQLPRATRDQMEPRFGADFGAVRVHSDSRAHALAQALDARAFTFGSEIFFAKGEFAPESDEGKYLIAHELTHVVQQGHAARPAAILRQEEPTAATDAAPMPEQAPENQPAADEQDEETEEITFQAEYSVSASGQTALNLIALAGDPLIQRQPPDKPAPSSPPAQPAPSAPPAQPAPQAAKPKTNVTLAPVTVLDPKIGQTKSGKSGETGLTLQSHFTRTSSRKTKRITKFSGTVTPVIQTTYLPGVDKKGNSAYGRGTTAEDKKAGNTSLEFHESCHIEDLKKYLDSHPLPEFTGKEGMTVDEFKAEVAKYDEALKKYWEAAGQASEQSTDCVGTKASFCK